MTRTDHFLCQTPAFPVYSAAFSSDRQVILGGGGGATRSGISNKIRLCSVDPKAKSLDTVTEYELGPQEDTPMAMAMNLKTKEVVAGINSAPDQLRVGTNENCRLFEVSDEAVKLVRTKKTFSATYSDREDYPYSKAVAISRNGTLVAVGSTNNQVAVLSYPSLEPAFSNIIFDGLRSESVYDVDFDDSGKFLAVTTTDKLFIYSIPAPSEKSESKPVQLERLKAISRDAVTIQSKLSFRAARFGRGPTATQLLAVLNAPPPSKKGGPRKAYAASFEFGGESKWTLSKTRVLGPKPVTAVDLNTIGTQLAYGCSDLSVGIVDATSFSPLLRILRTHEFPATALKFNPSGDLLCSASADNTVRFYVVPATFDATYGTPVALLFLALILVFLASLYQLRQQGLL